MTGRALQRSEGNPEYQECVWALESTPKKREKKQKLCLSVRPKNGGQAQQNPMEACRAAGGAAVLSREGMSPPI